MQFNKLRIAAKLWLSVGFIVASLTLLIAFAAVRSEQTMARSEAILAAADHKIDLSKRWATITDSAVGRLVVTALATEPAVVKMVGDSTAKAIAEINVLQKDLVAISQSPAEVAQMKKVGELRTKLLEETARMGKIKASGTATTEEMAQGAAAIQNAATPYLAAQAEFVRMQEEDLARTKQELAVERRSTVVIAGIVVGLLLVFTVVGAAFLIRSIRMPLKEAVDLAAAIAAGNLSRRGSTHRYDELGDLLRALNAMADSLARTVGEVRNAADQIATGSGEIAIGSQDLSQRTEEQASSLQQTAASMQQLGSTVRTSADSAREASHLANAATHVAVEGGAAVGQVVQTMEAISDASRRIGDIIGTIDGIAFQTNILALNAAVEAARAGEQGRGFAVVAAEVRSLAHRAADAAKEIKQLIEDSVSKVETGSVQVAQAGRTMTDVVAQVKRVNDLIGEISAATGEQTTGIGQVGHAVTQLDQVTQQNAALVEESAAAAASLRQQADRLVQAVGVFTLNEEARVAIDQARVSSQAVVVRKPAVVKRPAIAPAPAVADDDWQQF